MSRGKIMANTRHGRFPFENLALPGFDRTSPVKRFPPNGFGPVRRRAGALAPGRLADGPLYGPQGSVVLP